MIKLVISIAHWCNKIKLFQKHMGWKYTLPPMPPSFMEFKPISCNDLEWYVMASPTKSCKLDPIPTSLQKKILLSVSQLLTAIVNNSITLGTFPTCIKEALVQPLLKKANLDLINKNYRPVSNLSFVGKLIECVVADQVTSHITQHSLMEANQSCYHSHHSTESTLLKVKADILRAMDNQEVVCLVLLDLSAVFNTVNHAILIARLWDRFGIGGTALEWFRSYLRRSQCVAIGHLVMDGAFSDSKSLSQGVPQGSVLGPTAFTLCTTPLGDICRAHDILFHLYANGQQVYLSFKPANKNAQSQCMTKLQNCIEDTWTWMSFNFLMLNEDKTECIMFGTRYQLAKIESLDIKVDPTYISPVEGVRNLGFYMDNLLKNHHHINRICSQHFGIIKSVQAVQSRLDHDTAKTIIQALVLSKLDYCNSLLAWSAKYQLEKLQRVQNMACRVVNNLRKYDHISASLMGLHWLKVKEHIEYKIACLVFRCWEKTAPNYLAHHLPNKTSNRDLRSTNSTAIPILKCKNTQTRQASFAGNGPDTWNSLPCYIRQSSSLLSFKKLLKTHLFKASNGQH